MPATSKERTFQERKETLIRSVHAVVKKKETERERAEKKTERIYCAAGKSRELDGIGTAAARGKIQKRNRQPENIDRPSESRL